MVYVICSTLLLVGVLGLIAQLMLGGAHGGHHFGQHHAGHHHGGHHQADSHAVGRGRSFLMSLLSPLTIFSVFIGIGATGLLLKHDRLPIPEVCAASVAGGLVFYLLVIRNIYSFVFRFASTPSTALEGVVGHEAEALSSFNPAGTGLVRVTVDGQIVQILATLEDEDRAQAAEVVRGEQLTVTSVDGRTNSCRVSRI